MKKGEKDIKEKRFFTKGVRRPWENLFLLRLITQEEMEKSTIIISSRMSEDPEKTSPIEMSYSNSIKYLKANYNYSFKGVRRP